jgi:putative endonuclease
MRSISVFGSKPSDQRVQQGQLAEQHACDVLTHAGHSIVERNYRCRLGEIDIVAIDGDILVFVEVRSRGSNSFGGATVSPTKQRQVAKVASQYLITRRPHHKRCRFDVVVVTAGLATHIPDAWRLTADPFGKR